MPTSSLSPGVFVFRRAPARDATAATSRRLADLVLADDALDADALTARMLLLPPFERRETPYQGITAERPREAVPDVDDGPAPTIASATRLVQGALERAVDRAVDGATRVAVMTGGGVDSSALLALAVARARAKGGSAFGVALDFGGPGDDRPHLVALQQQLGCEIVRVRPEAAAPRMTLVHRGVDASPLTWPGAAMEIEAMATARAHGAECVLSGAGADELFDGEPRALAERVRAGAWREAVAAARRLRGFRAPASPVLRWLALPLASGLLPRRLRAWRAKRTAAALPAWLSERASRRVRAWREARIDLLYARDEGVSSRLASRLEAPHLEHLAWLRHQEEVASGLARRDPYLDAAVVATVTQLPQALLLHGDVRRGLFREALRGLVPEGLRMRLDKASFEPAFARFLDAAGGLASLRALASLPHLASLGLVEPGPFRAAFEAFAADVDDPASEGWGSVWPVLCVEAFLGGRARGSAAEA